MREFTLTYPIGLSAEAFWELRLDRAFDAYIAECDGQCFHLLQCEHTPDAPGGWRLDRKVRLTFRENPVPKALRGLFGDPEFAVNVLQRWHRWEYGEAQAMEYSIELPLIGERVSVKGRQWAEVVDDKRCTLFIRVKSPMSARNTVTLTRSFGLHPPAASTAVTF